MKQKITKNQASQTHFGRVILPANFYLGHPVLCIFNHQVCQRFDAYQKIDEGINGSKI